MTRRSLLQSLISAAAGSVLAKMPLAGKWIEPKPEEDILAYKDPSGNWVRTYDGAYVAGDAALLLDEFLAQKFTQREDETFMLYQRGEL